ncbi:TonB-dependent receptor plug domain-containing protein [Uliginosibacterium sp. H3]|uniref:TonB-dependent receptor plug domain-containing protein n=1 Tax=Uliginosibacterium silvisoli TaxID=3114758 RepID=A0ABU6K529_9RHOO|nr:TonB-dependent receptor plug domain-containing protein [Uliginosibacterium sp. H3]
MKKQWALMLVCVGVNAGTNEAAMAADEPAIEPVIVKGNYDNPVGSTDAASAGTVTSKLIANRPALRTGEILEFVPGVIVTQHSGDGKANQYFLRGFNLDHGTDFSTRVDGMPINMRTHAHGQGYTDLNFLIPELVSRIDYRKGPYAAEDGDFASAGAAYMRLFDRLPQGIASVTVGENGFGRTLLADSKDIGAGTFLYGLDMGHNSGPWEVSENLRKFNGLLRFSQGTEKEGWHATAMGYGSQWRATDQVANRAVADGSIGRFGTLDGSDGGKTSRYSLSLGADGKAGAGRYSASAYAVRSRLNLFSNFTYFLDHPSDLGDPVNGDQFEQAEKRDLVGFDTKYMWPAELGGLTMLNTLGLTGRYDKLGPVGLYSTEEQRRVSTTREDTVREGSYGVWFENSTDWTRWLRSVAGVRFDEYNFDVKSSLPENSGKKDAKLASPKFSLIFGPWSQTEFFLNWGRGFHSNDARGTVQTIDPKTGTPVDAVTPLVKTRGEEIGARSEWLPGLQTSLAVWRLKSDSELVFVGDAGTTEASRPGKRNGVEWNNHYVARPWLLFDADLSWSKARYADESPDGNYIPGAIEQVGTFGVTLDSLGPWSGQFQLRYFGPRALIEDNSVRSSSTTLAYMRVGYAFTPATKLSLDIFNLFDRKASDIDYYYTSRLKGEDPAGVDDIHSHPVEPRTFRVSLVHRF